MGIFDLFGGKKASESAKEQEQLSAAAQKEKEMQAAMDAHADLEWPGFPKLNPVRVEFYSKKALLINLLQRTGHYQSK